jgi:ABC-2 type transport system permease protein
VAYVWLVWLGVRRNVVGASRYPLGILNLTVAGPLYRLILPSFLLGSAFLVGGRAVGLARTAGTENFQGFLFLGAFMNILTVGALVSAAAMFTMEREVGTLEQSWATPAGRAGIGPAVALSGLAISLSGAVCCVLLGAAFFHVRFG